MGIGLDRVQGEGVIALGEFKRDAWHGGSGTMLDGQDDTIVTVPPEMIGITPGVEFRRSAQGLTDADGACAIFA